ncbi:MAG: FAD-dependent oxidoreductase [Desulfotalea sp.]
MAKVIFGFWDGKLIDNRQKQIFDIADEEQFADFDHFDAGNPIKFFMGGHGFFAFDSSVGLFDALYQHMQRVADESCGKCTPCRVGTQIITEKLAALVKRSGTIADLKELLDLALQVRDTSLCGLGQTATVPVIEVIKHFADELEKELSSEPVISQPSTSYVTAPCIEACPSKVDVPKYIDYIKDGKFTHSMGVILLKYPMVATCGRVCVRFCEQACRRTQVDEAVGIKTLKRFVADHEEGVINDWFSAYKPPVVRDESLKIAVVGSGPAGIAAAYHLLLRGYHVDMFEQQSVPGGMAATGIPEYRLPKKVLNKEVAIIETLGGKIYYNQRLGRDITVNTLLEKGYKSVFLGIGSHMGRSLGVAGEDPKLIGYDFGVDFLLRLNRDYIDLGLPMTIGKKVVVVGGGNVAMDCARSALRMKGVEEVHLVYRRTENDMPADHEEVVAAQAEGVVFHTLTNPTKLIIDNEAVAGIELVKMAQGEIDAKGRRKVTPIAESEFILECDHIIPAIGQAVETDCFAGDSGIEFSRWNTVKTNDNLMTNRRGVFAGGDCVRGPATLIQAMEQGAKAAESIDDYLSYGRVKFKPKERMSQLVGSVQSMISDGVDVPIEHLYRVKVDELDPEKRKKIFEEVEKPISTNQAYREAERCMRCYRVYSVITER